MKKLLLASGCSFTDENFESAVHPEMICDWPKWPELLAKKLDMDCVNLAKSGMGNEYIYTTLLHYILNEDRNNIGLVIPAWTQCQRKDYQYGYSWRSRWPQKSNYWRNKRIDPDGDIFSWMRKSLDICLSFQIMCERYNLPYMQVQMLSPYIDWLYGLKPADMEIERGKFPKGFRYTYPGDAEKDNLKIIKMIDSYEDKINIDKFLGWPLSHEFGGYSLQKRLIGWNHKKFKDNVSLGIKEPSAVPGGPTMISKSDAHPNALGHKVISDFIYDRLG